MLGFVKGILCDLDGILYVGDEPIKKVAGELLKYTKMGDIKIRYLTNTTRVSQQQLLEKLLSMGIPAELNEIISPPSVAVDYLKQQGIQNIHLCVRDDIKSYFKDFRNTKHGTQAIVIGDIGHKWSYGLMNTLFRILKHNRSVELIALHKNRFLTRGDGLGLDIGPFVAALEYAANQEALVVGKPSAAVFEHAVQHIGLPKESLIMIGDDLDSDIIGAQNVGIKSVLVKTGKYDMAYSDRSPIKPDFIFDDISKVLTAF
ncbi:MAG: TIGR01458 family HAD-type hydrolase [Aureispira sp.]|nr:TIGR01458 family HAD-type hydrolase [Aureispira sp.]